MSVGSTIDAYAKRLWSALKNTASDPFGFGKMAEDALEDAFGEAFSSLDSGPPSTDQQPKTKPKTPDEIEAEQKQEFEQEFAKIADHAAALVAVENAPAKKLKLEVQEFTNANNAVEEQKGIPAWDKATEALPELARTATALVLAKQAYDQSKSEFDSAWNGMTDFAEAEQLAGQGLSDRLSGEVSTFQEVKQGVETDRLEEEWGLATAKVGDLQQASKALVEAKQTFDTAKSEFESAWNGMTDFAAADQLSGQVLSDKLSGELTTFKERKTAVETDKLAEEWGPAKEKVGPLQEAAKALVEAKQLFDTGKSNFELAWNGVPDRDAATNIADNALPRVKELLSTEINAFNGAKKIVTEAQGNEEWKTALDGIAELTRTAEELTKAEPKASAQAKYETAYTEEVKRAHENAALVVTAAASNAPMSKKLDPELKAYLPKGAAHDKAVSEGKWAIAEGTLGELKTTAVALNDAKTKFDSDKLNYDAAILLVTSRDEAQKIADKPPSELTDEVTAFTDAIAELATEETNGEWEKAALVAAKLQTAASKLVTDHAAWTLQSEAFNKIFNIYKQAYYVAYSAPSKIQADFATEIAAFQNANTAQRSATTSKDWGALLVEVGKLDTNGHILVAAMEKYSLAKDKYEIAYSKIEKIQQAALALWQNAPPAVRSLPAFTEYVSAHNPWNTCLTAEDWDGAFNKLGDLETKSRALTNPALSSSFGAPELQAIEISLQGLAGDITSNTRNSTNDHVKALTNEIKAFKLETENHLAASDAIQALLALGKLKDAIERAKLSRADYDSNYKPDYAAATANPAGKVTAAKALGTTPAPLATARDKQLNASDLLIKKLAKVGKFSLACKKIAEWVKQAEGWINGWTEAVDAHATLHVAPPDLPDEAKLNDLLSKDGGAKVLDALVLEMGSNPRRDVLAKVMKARFGTDIELKKFKPVMVDKMIEKKIEKKVPKLTSEGNQELDSLGQPIMVTEMDSGGKPVMVTEMDSEGKPVMVTETNSSGEAVKIQKIDDKGKPVWEQVADTTTKGSKSVKKLYDLMLQVPEQYTANSPSLKKIVRVGGAHMGGSYYAGDKRVVLECGRQSQTSGTYIGDSSQLPDVTDDLYKPVGSQSLSYFNWTTLHEIGHAVDDKQRFMDSNGFNANSGGWSSYGGDVAPIAEAIAGDNRFKAAGTSYDVEYIKKLLSGKSGFRPPESERPSKPSTVANQTDWDHAREEIEKWVDAVRVDKEVWENGSAAKTLAIGGRAIHEAYKGDWVSYDVSARSRGITGYQFRAPGEWFSELYAAYYSEKLKPGHPFAAVAESLT